MSVYVIAQVKFRDVSLYRAYQAEFGKVFAKSKGRLLAADESPEILEGQWDKDKVILMEFPNEAYARDFLNDPNYHKISENRRAGADTFALLVNSVAG